MSYICFAFDCDGTLEDGQPPGPIPNSLLRRLKELGYIITVVSNSPFCEKTEFLRIGTGDRLFNLMKVKEIYPSCARYVYVADNAGHDQIAKQAGYEYVHPLYFHEFLTIQEIL